MAIQDLVRSSNSGIPMCNMSEAAELAVINLLCHNPVYMIGQPGGGKSALGPVCAEMLSQALQTEVDFDPLQCVSQEQCDVRGMPRKTDCGEYTEFLPMSTFFPDRPTLVMLDEFGQAYPKLQLAYMQPLNERTIDNRRLPDHVYFLLNGNRKEDMCSVESTPKHAQNRFFWMEVHVTIEEWVAWGHQNGIDPRILACVSNHEDLIFGFDTENPCPAYSTVRSLHRLSGAMAVMSERRSSFASLEKLAAGWIGQSAATKLMMHIEYADKCKPPAEIFANPESIDVSEPGPTFAMVHSCIANIMKEERVSQKKLKQFVAFTDQMQRSTAVMAVKHLMRANDKLVKSKVLADWVIANSEFLGAN